MRGFFFFLIFCLTINVFSQNIRSFNDYVENYPETVASMFSANLSEEDRAFIFQFSTAWNDNTFTNNERLEIIVLSNGFLEKRARNINYWMLWRCLLSFKKPENIGKGYDAWMQAMRATVEDRRSQPATLQTMMSATFELLEKRHIYSSAGHVWKASNHNHRYNYVDEMLTITVDNCDLICIVGQTDSIYISQTSGRYSVAEQEWKGTGGVVYWEGAGFTKDDMSARLNNYSINMKRPEYEVDSVMFTHNTYFPTPVMGKLIDKVRRVSNPLDSRYPEFITYSVQNVFNNLYPNVDYIGGIWIRGAQVIGSGSDDRNAIMILRSYNDSLIMNLRAKSFEFRKERLSSRSVNLVIHFSDDSIYHTNLAFSYVVDEHEVNLFRSESATSQAPYINTYHRMNMNFEQLIWKTDEPLMSFSMARGSSTGRGQFKSQNYFDQRYYDRLQYMDNINPLVAIRQLAANRGRVFSSSVYANHIKTTLSEARIQLINIAREGFILFDNEMDRATVLPILFETINAATQRIDFDVIDMQSRVNHPTRNATFDVRTHNMVINGINSFMVSDSQKVIITPRGGRVAMQKNRGMEIDGRIDAGRIEIYGDLMRFNYEGFKVDLEKVDSLYIHIPTGEISYSGRPVLRRLTTAITDLSGRLLIDQPDNKSGRKSLKQYPIFFNDSHSRAHTRYGGGKIEGGAYDNEEFFFELDPFVLDSIDNLVKRLIAFKGTFHSAGIFENMRQTLIVQPDYSLGFVHNADTALVAYNQSNLYAEVRLSNRGLEASGKLDYLTTSIHAEEFKLYPDSMNVINAKDFIMRKQTSGVEFPNINAQGSQIHWLPKKEQMFIMDNEFSMYNLNTKLDGMLLLTPRGLSGKGLIDILGETAEIFSGEFKFGANKFNAEQSNLKMRPVKEGPYRVLTVDSLRSEINYDTRRGRFVANGSKHYTHVDFPSNKFAGYVEEMIWEIDNALLNINSIDTIIKPVDFKYAYPGESKGSRYYSTTRGADSLSFVSPRATLDLTRGDLKAEGVNLIKAHDAIVYPNEGKLTVNTEGEIELDRSKIVFNDKQKQFTVYDADLKMQGRKQYIGYGKYDYVDETGTISTVEIPYIGTSGRTGKTTANGVIPAASEFKLSPYFRYQGNMLLASDEPYPIFEGSAQIVHECDLIQPDWFRFESSINSDSIYLPIGDEPLNISGNRIYNGFFINYDSIYPTLFSMSKTPGDRQLINTSGVLTYNKDSMMYFLATKEKLWNRDTIGNLLSLNRDKCIMSAEGRFMSLGTDFGSIKTDVTGKLQYNLNNHETRLDVMMSFEFHFDNILASIIASNIENFEGLSGVNIQRPIFIRGMNEWLGVTRSEAYRRAALLGNVDNFPKELSDKTIVLTQLKLYWDHDNRLYRSIGKIGVGNLFGYQVNRLVDGMVEITKRPNNDSFDIYLKMDDDNWVYFSYTRENMQVITSDRDFNDRLAKLPQKQRRSSERRPGFRFTYMSASTERLNSFQRKYQQFAIQEPSDMIQDTNVPVQPQQPINTPVDEAPIIEVE